MFKRAFAIFDADGSGKMNFSELDKLMVELSSGLDPSDEQVLQVRIMPSKKVVRLLSV